MEVGDTVDGRYRLLEMLGEGAAGKVFRAEDCGRNNMFVALKLLHAKDPRWEGFFRREFEVLSRLHHPNLVAVYDFGPAPQENTYYFTQELVVGSPLLDVLAGKKVDEVAGIFIEICRALEFIHGHGVLHRDLKPANILVQKHADPGERVRVLDFGLWRELDPTPQKGARWAGTPPYLASEVLRGYGHSICADLYAVGVTLFQAVTRKLPHGRGTPQELLQARKEPAPDLHGIVADAMAELIERLLQEDAALRPQTAAEVAASLSALVPNHTLAMPITLGRARLVGRDREREALEGAISAVVERRPDAPRLVVVSGPDGIGKSRFVGEVKAHAQLTGGRSAIGTCQEDVRWRYRPFGELLRSLAPTVLSTALNVREREVVEILSPDLSVPSANAPQPPQAGDEDRFNETATGLFLGFGSSQPCVLIVEDVQWVDAGSLSLLTTLLRRAKEAALLVVVTAGIDAEHVVPEELTRAAEGELLRVSLTPLSRDAVAQLAANLLGVPSVPDKLADALMAHSNGFPLLVEEILALFIERGDLTRGESGWELDAFDSAAVAPAELLGVLAERLQRLDEVEQCALCALAVFNRPAGPKLLAAISGFEREEVKRALQSTEKAGLIRVVGSEDARRPRVVFRHPQIREALVDELREGGVLAEWHLNAAEVLEERAGDNASVIADTLAHHYEMGEDIPKAVEWLLIAVEHAMQSSAFEDAISLSKRATRLLARAVSDDASSVAPELLVKADLLAARALYVAGRIPDARAFLEGAIARVDAVDDPEGFGELHVWLARACNQAGTQDQGRAAVDRALERLDEGIHPLAIARLRIARAELLMRQSPAVALTDVQRALKLAKKQMSTSDELEALEALTWAHHYMGNADKAISSARKRIKLSERHDRMFHRIAALRDLAITLSIAGHRLEGRNHLNDAHRFAREAGYVVEEALIVKAIGQELYVSGSFREAISRFQQAATLSAQMGQVADRADALKWLGMCYAARGDFARAIDHLRAAVSAFDRAGHLDSIISTRARLAAALIAKNEIDEAELLLKDAARRLPEEGLTTARAEVYSEQGNLFLARGDFDKARTAYLMAVAIARSSKDQFMLGEALVGFGQLLLRFRFPSRAYRMAKRAEWIFEDLDARGQLKRITPLINATEGLSGGNRAAPGP